MTIKQLLDSNPELAPFIYMMLTLRQQIMLRKRYKERVNAEIK